MKSQTILFLAFVLISFSGVGQEHLLYPTKGKSNRFDWSTVKYQKDSALFNTFIKNNKSDFEYYLMEEEYSPTINDLHRDLYLLDLNGDNELDIIFDGFSGGEPYVIKIYLFEENGYQRVLNVQQGIRKMSFTKGVLSQLCITDWGCCAANIEYNYIYDVDFNRKNKSFELTYTSQSYQELNWSQDLLDSAIRFQVKYDKYNLRFEPSKDDSTSYEIEGGEVFGNSIGLISKGTVGYALGQKKDSTGRVWWFVAIEAERKLVSTFYYEFKAIPNVYYLGWLSSRYVTKLKVVNEQDLWSLSEVASEVCVKTQSNLDSLDKKEIELFLQVVTPRLKNNIEHSQWSNELLFKVLQKYPREVLSILNTNAPKIDVNYILEELRDPIHDLIPLDEVLKEVKLSGSSSVTDDVLQALEYAKSNSE
jgi:hypothetical protein